MTVQELKKLITNYPDNTDIGCLISNDYGQYFYSFIYAEYNEISLNKCRMLFANYQSNGYFSCTNLENYSNDDSKNTIDCGTNEELFDALTPINDKSDINQWFINYDDNSWFKSESYHIENYARKANIKEILQHFNK